MIYMTDVAAEAQAVGLVTWIGSDNGGGRYSTLTIMRLRAGVERRTKPEFHSMRCRVEELASIKFGGWWAKLTNAQAREAREFIRVQGRLARRQRARPGASERLEAAARHRWQRQRQRRDRERRDQRRWESDPRTVDLRLKTSEQATALRKDIIAERERHAERVSALERDLKMLRSERDRLLRESEVLRRDADGLCRDVDGLRKDVASRTFQAISGWDTTLVDGIIATGSTVEYRMKNGTIRAGVIQQRLVHHGWFPEDGFYRINDEAVAPERVLRLLRGSVGINVPLPVENPPKSTVYAGHEISDGVKL